VSSKTKLEPFEKLLQNIFKIITQDDLSGFIIQPTYGIAEPSLQSLLEFYDLVYPYYNEVRIVPQLQKLIGVP